MQWELLVEDVFRCPEWHTKKKVVSVFKGPVSLALLGGYFPFFYLLISPNSYLDIYAKQGDEKE